MVHQKRYLRLAIRMMMVCQLLFPRPLVLDSPTVAALAVYDSPEVDDWPTGRALDGLGRSAVRLMS